MALSRLTAILIIGGFGHAVAGPQFTAEDIVRHFQQQSAQPAPAKIKKPVQTVARGATVSGASESSIVLPLTGARRKTAAAATESAVQQGNGASGYDLLITFETGSDQLTPQAQLNLDSFAVALGSATLSKRGFEIQGHTDAVGPAAANQLLSERRAQAVVSYLLTKGVSANRLVAKGYGESRPMMADPYHAQNRRVETRLIQ